MERPILLSTKVTNEAFAGITYYLDGGIVPSLTVELLQVQRIFFEHHILIWKHPSIKIFKTYGCNDANIKKQRR